MTRRRSVVPKNFQFEQPARVHNGRKTVSGNRFNEPKSVRGSDFKRKTRKPSPARLVPRRNSTEQPVMSHELPAPVVVRRKTVTSGENEYSGGNEIFPIRLDRIDSLSNVQNNPFKFSFRSALRSIRENSKTNESENGIITSETTQALVSSLNEVADNGSRFFEIDDELKVHFSTNSSVSGLSLADEPNQVTTSSCVDRFFR